jgi:hypothetical protein
MGFISRFLGKNAAVDTDIPSLTAAAIQKAKDQIDEKFGNAALFGFALCTDDDVRTLYHVACTRDWVAEREEGYPDIGYIYVEWTESGDDTLFDEINAILSQLADQDHGCDKGWAAARNKRFESLVAGLSDCRQAGLFDEPTLLCVASTDPSDHLEALAMHAVDRLNTTEVAGRFAEALGYEKHRKST